MNTPDTQEIDIPRFIYGTAWKEERTKHCVKQALESGFTALDTANQRKHYYEASVGDAIKEVLEKSNIVREDLFLQSKFTYISGQDHRLPYDEHAPLSEQVNQSFESSLEHLGATYLDSFLLHGPELNNIITDDDIEVWRTMERLKQAGLVRMIGISNCNIEQLEQLFDYVESKPEFVQNRCFARLGWDRDIREFCKKHDILYQGFSLLTANREILNYSKFNSIVQKTGLTPAQVIFQAAHKMNIITLTGTTNPDHMNEDIHCDHVALDAQDVDAIENMVK